MILSLAQIIEGLLFYFGDTISITTLTTYTKKSEEEVREALTILNKELTGRGVVLVVQNEKVTLATHPDISTILTSIQKEELEGELYRLHSWCKLNGERS